METKVNKWIVRDGKVFLTRWSSFNLLGVLVRNPRLFVGPKLRRDWSPSRCRWSCAKAPRGTRSDPRRRFCRRRRAWTASRSIWDVGKQYIDRPPNLSQLRSFYNAHAFSIVKYVMKNIVDLIHLKTHVSYKNISRPYCQFVFSSDFAICSLRIKPG